MRAQCVCSRAENSAMSLNKAIDAWSSSTTHHKDDRVSSCASRLLQWNLGTGHFCANLSVSHCGTACNGQHRFVPWFLTFSDVGAIPPKTSPIWMDWWGCSSVEWPLSHPFPRLPLLPSSPPVHKIRQESKVSTPSNANTHTHTHTHVRTRARARAHTHTHTHTLSTQKLCG